MSDCYQGTKEGKKGVKIRIAWMCRQTKTLESRDDISAKSNYCSLVSFVETQSLVERQVE